MGELKIKRVTAFPVTPEAETIYVKKSPSDPDFEMRVSGNSGPAVPLKLNNIKAYNSYEDRVSSLVMSPSFASVLPATPTEGSFSFTPGEMYDGAVYEVDAILFGNDGGALSGGASFRVVFAAFNSPTLSYSGDPADRTKISLKCKIFFYGATASSRSVQLEIIQESYRTGGGSNLFGAAERAYATMNLAVNTTTSKTFDIQGGGSANGGGSFNARLATDFIKIIQFK